MTYAATRNWFDVLSSIYADVLTDPRRQSVAVSCNASSAKDNLTECDNALAKDNSTWRSSGRGPGEWFKLIYSEPVYVSSIASSFYPLSSWFILRACHNSVTSVTVQHLRFQVLRSHTGGLKCQTWNVTYSHDLHRDTVRRFLDTKHWSIKECTRM